MGEIITLIIYMSCTLIIGISIFFNRSFYGELTGFDLNVSNFEIIILLLITLGGFLLVYIFYLSTKNNKRYLTRGKWKINIKRFNIFFCLGVSSQLAFTLITGVGKVGGSSFSSISFIFSMLGIDVLFNIYYFLCRDMKSKLFILNILLYCLLKLSQGWTAFFFLIALFEIYFYFYKRKMMIMKDIIKVISIPLFSILIGGKIYQYAYSLKFKIRYGEVIRLSYFEGIVNLVNRLSNFNMIIGSYQNFEKIKSLFLDEKLFFLELLAVFRPMLPRLLMPFKEFRTLNNLVVQSFYPKVVYFTSADFGLINYSLLMLNIGLFEFIFWVISTVIFFSFSRRILNSFEQFYGQLDFLYFLLLINIFNVASSEMVFGYGYLQIIYVILILFIFRIIKLERPIQERIREKIYER